jgi:hypothetical protein
MIDHTNKIEKFIPSKNDDLVPYNEPYLARFEPVLFFYLSDELMQDERTNLSSIFSSQYRRFIKKDLTPEEVNDNLDEFYFIFYISPKLPSYMQNNRRIKFYEFNLPKEKQDTNDKIKLMERLISRLLHDLGMFYPEQANNLSDDQQNRIIAKKLTGKAAICYKTLAIETDKTIQRYIQKDQAK